MSTIEDLRDEITREERVTNLRADGTVSAEEIHRRRRQMFLLAIVVLVGLLFTTVANDVWTSVRDRSWIDPDLARFALIGFGVISAAYLYDKEQHLKKLSRLGRDVHDLDAALAATMLQSAFVADATIAVHASLELDEVLTCVVDQACMLVGAASASLRLADDDGDLHPVATQVDIGGRKLSEPGEPNEDLLRVVGRTQEPALLNSGTVSVLCIPLLHDGRLLGLITLGAGAADRFTDADAALLGRFATPAANAIEHAQRFEAVMFLLDPDSAGPEDVTDLAESPAA